MFSITRPQELDETARLFLLSSLQEQKRRGRRFLLVVLLVACATIPLAFAGWIRSGIEDIYRAELGPAMCLIMLIGPVAIRFWRKCRAQSDLLLFRRELWLHAFGLTASATILACAFGLMRHYKADAFTMVSFLGLYAVLIIPAAVAFIGRLLACWRGESWSDMLTNQVGWSAFMRHLRWADMAESIAVFLTTTYCGWSLLAVALRLIGGT